ncbi:MAG: Gfo/Idh/MocA family oxidoreductase [Acidimicrobiales bacterium]
MAGDVRYGIIGTGMMGVEHLRNLQALPGARVTAVADPHAGSLEAVVLAAGGPDQASFERLDDHRGLLDSGLCDAVVVATPNMTHCDVMLDVLARPVHVLVEKPLATTVADCRRIMAAAEAAPVSLDGRRRVVWVGLEYRYMPPVRRLAELVRAGAVGTVRMVAIREHRFPFLAKVGDWNRFTRNTGGTLVEKCCHFFDLMNHLTQRRPVQVFASGAQDVNHLDERYAGETPDVLDNAFVIVDYEGGMRASLDLCMFAEASRHQEEISVVGDLGKIEARLPGGQVHLGVRKRGRPGSPPRSSATNGSPTRASTTGRATLNTSTSSKRCAPISPRRWAWRTAAVGGHGGGRPPFDRRGSARRGAELLDEA